MAWKNFLDGIFILLNVIILVKMQCLLAHKRASTITELINEHFLNKKWLSDKKGVEKLSTKKCKLIKFCRLKIMY